MKGIAYVKYGNRASSTRVRFEQFRPHLEEEGIEVDLVPLLDNAYLDRIFGGRRPSYAPIARSYLRRAGLIREKRGRVAFSWVHCETFPYLPGLAERLVLAGGAPVIYDFDDAIFHQYDRHPNPFVRRVLGRKLEPLLRGARLAICGNAYLRDYAAHFCRRTEIVPTVADTDTYRPAGRREPGAPVTVGWIGSPSTWSYVRPVIPLLETLRRELGLRIRVVGAGKQADLPPAWEAVPWSEAAEIALIQGMDIGIMPLPDEPWARGKCGYKLIQYMACGLPVIASPVGVNVEIVEDGSDGFHARSEAEWAASIRRLAGNGALRAEMGARGRARIERRYSLAAHGPRLARMIREAIEEVRAPEEARAVAPCAG